MVVVSPIAVDPSAIEKVADELESVNASHSLNYCKSWLALPFQRHLAIPLDRAAEAALSVDEADDPLLDSWPFLLIVRTGRIVTAHDPTQSERCDMASTAGFTGVPANSQLQLQDHSCNGQT